MKLSNLKNKEIKNIFYQDEHGGIGIEDETKRFHLIEYGSIFFEFIDNSLIEMVNDCEKEGITITKIEEPNKDSFQKNKIEKDRYWSSISEKKISSFDIYKSTLIVSKGGSPKTQAKEYISTIELIFKNGERLFISNAGYFEKEEIRGMTDDFIIYRKRKIGQELKIIE